MPHNSNLSNLVKRFPTVETVTVEWKQYRGLGDGPPVERGVFSHSIRAAAGELEPILPCLNPDCQGGGFEILEVMQSMVGSRRQEKTGLLVCIGWERTKSGQTKPSPCTRVIDYQIRLTYRKKDDSRRSSKRHHRDE